MPSVNTAAPVLLDRTESGTYIITLNRPDSLNALNVSLLQGLVDALREVHAKGPVVIRGAGRAFCVGEDLKETLAPKTGSAEELRVAFELLQDVTRLMVNNPSPIVAAVHGFAVGGGIEVALAADLVIFAEGTRIRFPEVPIGHAHTGGISSRLPLMVGLLKAKELLLTGRWVDADEAVDLRLANEVVADADARAEELANQFVGQPARSMAASKMAIETASSAQLESTLRLEVESALYCFASVEANATFTQFTSTGTVAGAR